MTIQQLLQATTECDNGLLDFNLGTNRSFLYKKKWYPLRATVNFAKELNDESELTTDRALLELGLVLPYTRIDNISFDNQLPVSIDSNEALNEVKILASILRSLTSEH